MLPFSPFSLHDRCRNVIAGLGFVNEFLRVVVCLFLIEALSLQNHAFTGLIKLCRHTHSLHKMQILRQEERDVTKDGLLSNIFYTSNEIF